MKKVIKWLETNEKCSSYSGINKLEWPICYKEQSLMTFGKIYSFIICRVDLDRDL